MANTPLGFKGTENTLYVEKMGRNTVGTMSVTTDVIRVAKPTM